MQFRMSVLSTWGNKATGANKAQLALDYPSAYVSDITGQPSANLHPDPNQYVVEAVVDEATKDAISADGDYFVVSIDEIEEAI